MIPNGREESITVICKCISQHFNVLLEGHGQTVQKIIKHYDTCFK